MRSTGSGDALPPPLLFRALSLPSNNLVGTVPESISQLSALVVLSLASNALSGAVPAGIGQLALLTYDDAGRL